MGALFHRERTGEATIVDVSLLGTGLWAMGQAVALSLLMDRPWAPTRAGADGGQPAGRRPTRPRTVAAWRSPACRPASTGRRCASRSGAPTWPPTRVSPITPHCSPTASRPSQRSRRSSPATSSTSGVSGCRASAASGRSCRTRSRRRSIRRPSPTATCRTARAPPGCRSSWSPPRCSSTSSRRARSRAPEFNEHGDEILGELGFDWDTIVDLIKGRRRSPGAISTSFRYDGKRVLVVGGATGMGAAVAAAHARRRRRGRGDGPRRGDPPRGHGDPGKPG